MEKKIVNKNDNLKKFGIDKPPYIATPEQKKAGWARKQQAQAMMNKVKDYMEMPQAEFQKLLDDIKNNPDKYTVQDVLLYKYATKAFNGDKFMLDWIDRNISKAPTQLTGEDGEDLKINIVLQTEAIDRLAKAKEQQAKADESRNISE